MVRIFVQGAQVPEGRTSSHEIPGVTFGGHGINHRLDVVVRQVLEVKVQKSGPRDSEVRPDTSAMLGQ